MNKVAKNVVRKSTKGAKFTREEREAMQARVKEVKAEASGDAADGESEVLARIAAMGEADRQLAERLHAIVKSVAPQLTPRTWYGMPAYANDGNVLCFFQSAQKFKTRYATLGFSATAKLDEGAMWPVAFALTTLTAAEETRIRALLIKAIG